MGRRLPFDRRAFAAGRARASRDAALPLLPLRDQVVFPGQVDELAVGRLASAKAVERALGGDRAIVLVAQREPTDDPEPAGLFSVGCIAHVARVRAVGGALGVVIWGLARARLVGPARADDTVAIEPITETDAPDPELPPAAPALVAAIARTLLDRLGALGRRDVGALLAALPTVGGHADLIAGTLELAVAESAALLAEPSGPARAARLLDRERLQFADAAAVEAAAVRRSFVRRLFGR